jgi:hypothetical protein
VTDEPVAREAEPQFLKPEGMPSGRGSGPLKPREQLKRTSGPLEPREPSPAPAPDQRTSGPLEPREPAPLAPTEQRTRGPILPRRLGFSGAALASLARRSNDH